MKVKTSVPVVSGKEEVAADQDTGRTADLRVASANPARAGIGSRPAVRAGWMVPRTADRRIDDPRLAMKIIVAAKRRKEQPRISPPACPFALCLIRPFSRTSLPK
jgi:hypothetical protein